MAESRMALEALFLHTLQENECFAKLTNLFIKIKIVLKFIYSFIQQTLESLLCPRPWEDKDKWDKVSAAKSLAAWETEQDTWMQPNAGWLEQMETPSFSTSVR